VTRRAARKSGAVIAAAVLLALMLLPPRPLAAQSPAPTAPTTTRAAAPAVELDRFEKKPLLRSTPKAGPTSRATTQKAAAGKATGAPAGGFDVRRVATALGIVLALILLFRWVARRFFGVAGAGRATRAVQVLSRSPLSPKQQLVLLRVGRRLLVVADGAGQMNTLSEITDPDEVAALVGQLQDDHAARATKTFGSLFGKMQGKYDADPDASHAEHAGAPVASARSGGPEEERDDPAVTSTRRELSGLMDKVRLLSRQFKSP